MCIRDRHRVDQIALPVNPNARWTNAIGWCTLHAESPLTTWRWAPKVSIHFAVSQGCVSTFGGAVLLATYFCRGPKFAMSH